MEQICALQHAWDEGISLDDSKEALERFLERRRQRAAQPGFEAVAGDPDPVIAYAVRYLDAVVADINPPDPVGIVSPDEGEVIQEIRQGI